MTDEELQRELQTRIKLHKLTITGAYWEREYIKAEQESVIKLPNFIIEGNATAFSNKLLTGILLSGTLEQEYEKAWDGLAELLP